MKARLLLSFVVLLIIALLPNGRLSAQTITTNGIGGGAWSATSTWAGGVVPTGAGTITIASTDSIIFDVPVTITGTVVKQSSKKDSIGAGGSLTFASGSTYEHAVNGGSVPKSTWSSGSTCLLTGLSGTMPSNMAQNFYNLTVNCPSYSGNLNLGWQNATVTLGGTLTVTNTGYTHTSITTPTAQFRLFGGNGKCTINNLVINGYGGSMTPMGSSYVDTIVVVGNIIISSGGALFLANNSSASGIFVLQGNLAIIDSGFVTKSNNANLSKILFAGTGTQTLTVPAATSSTGPFLSSVNFEVANGSTLAFPATKDTLSGAGSFKVDSGATIVCNHPLGIDGIVRNTGANGGGNSIANGSSFVFSGSSAQVTGSLMPAIVNNLTIANANGVKLSQATTINGVLNLVAGPFNVAVGYTLGPSGSIIYGTGTLTSVESPDQSKTPLSFSLRQNYPNPFNPSTVIGYELPKSSTVKITVFDMLGHEIQQLLGGIQSAGYHKVTFNAQNLASGMYFYKIQAGTFTQTRKMILLK